MYDILYPSLNGSNHPAWSATAAADAKADEPWRFTDPAARALYAHQGRLEQLKDDVLAYGMCNGRLQTISNMSLSCEAFPRVSALCERALAILRQTVPFYPV